MYICIVYFPNDGLNKELSTELTDELISNYAALESTGSAVLLFGDYNGRIKLLRDNGRKSPNGDLVDLFCEVTGAQVLNCSEKCTGKFTWFRNAMTSTIDYAIANN